MSNLSACMRSNLGSLSSRYISVSQFSSSSSSSMMRRGIVINPTSTSTSSRSYRFYSSSSSSSSSSPSDSGHSSTSSSSSSSPARRLKIPTAKAKASASRALREKVKVTSNPSSSSSSTSISNPSTSTDSIQFNKSSPTATSSVEFPFSSSQFDSDGKLITTRPLLRDVVAYATSESYDFDQLIKSGRLPKGWVLLEDDEVIHVPSWPPLSTTTSSPSSTSSVNDPVNNNPSLLNSNIGDAFIFRSGSYVTWGMEEEQSRRFRRNVILGRQDGRVEGGKYDSVGDETMEYLIDVTQPTHIVGDVLVIGSPPLLEPDSSSPSPSSTSSSTSSSPPDDDWSPLLARLAFSQGLARSARLTVQESLLSTYLTSVSQIPQQLEKTGAVPLGRKEVIRKLGTLLKTRQTISLGRDNMIDEPEVYWENWKIEKHYKDICHTLDIKDRFQSINEKLDQAENLMEVLRALLTEGSSHRMEVIIIALIALEATLALISHGWVPDPKSWEWLGYPKDLNSSSHHSTSSESTSVPILLSQPSFSAQSGPRLV